MQCLPVRLIVPLEISGDRGQEHFKRNWPLSYSALVSISLHRQCSFLALQVEHKIIIVQPRFLTRHVEMIRYYLTII